MKRMIAILLFCAAAVPAVASDFKSEWLAEFDAAERKLITLAKAMPATKYTWRPMEGVRSVSEVYMHLAGAGYATPLALGVRPPAGLSRDMEQKVIEKQEVVEHLRAALKHLRDAVATMPDTDFERAPGPLSKAPTRRAMLLHTIVHLHEHLGQSIAYARMNGVTPPWTE